MANSENHIIGGCGLALLGYLVDRHRSGQPADPGEMLGVGISGALGGIAPDILEPATNPRHRKTAHSGGALVTALKTYSCTGTTSLNESQRTVLKAFVLGYVSHLVLDSDTPAGIPIV